MPDIFDQVASAPAAPAKGDIFDQAADGATNGSKGDIFDQVLPDKAFQPDAAFKRNVAEAGTQFEQRQTGLGNNEPTTDMLEAIANDPGGPVKGLLKFSAAAAMAPVAVVGGMAAELAKQPYLAAADAIAGVVNMGNSETADMGDYYNLGNDFGGNLKKEWSENLPGEPLPIDKFFTDLSRTSRAAGVVGKLSQGVAETAPMAAVAGLPEAAQKLITRGFTVDMLAKAPGTAKALYQEYQKPADQQDSDKITSLISDAAQQIGFGTLGAAHEVAGMWAKYLPEAQYAAAVAAGHLPRDTAADKNVNWDLRAGSVNVDGTVVRTPAGLLGAPPETPVAETPPPVAPKDVFDEVAPSAAPVPVPPIPAATPPPVEAVQPQAVPAPATPAPIIPTPQEVSPPQAAPAPVLPVAPPVAAPAPEEVKPVIPAGPAPSEPTVAKPPWPTAVTPVSEETLATIPLKKGNVNPLLEFKLGRTQDGKWTYAYNINTNNSGQGTPHVGPFESRQAAVRAGLARAFNYIDRSLARTDTTDTDKQHFARARAALEDIETKETPPPSTQAPPKKTAPTPTSSVPEEQKPTEVATPTGSAVDLRPAVRELAYVIRQGPLDKQTAAAILAKAYGGTMAQGKFDTKDLGDAVEMAMNHILLAQSYSAGSMSATPEHAIKNVKWIKSMLERLPTQSTRTAEQDKMQQFSTIPSEAYVAGWVANMVPSDVMLEPSAGVGGLAVFGKMARATVVSNELSPRRADLLAQTGTSDHISRHNAEHLNALLEPAMASGAVPRPTVVVMNPPFSNSANTSESNTLVGAKHVEEALKLLPQGGRLVAIVGSGMASDRPAFRKWWDKIAKTYTIRANIGVSGKEYAKYGTTFDNQLIVIDKTGPTKSRADVVLGPDIKRGPGGMSGSEGLRAPVAKVEDLIPLLERIRNERQRPQNTQPAPVKPSGVAPTEPAGGAEPGELDAHPGVGAPGGAGRPGGGPGPAQPGGQGPGGLGPTGRGPSGGGATPVGSQPPAGVGPAGKPGPHQQPGGGHVEGGKRNDDGVKPIPEATGGLGTKPEFTAADKNVGLDVEQAKAGQRQLSDAGVYSEYGPQKVVVAGSKPHPTPLVEPTAMAAVQPVDPKYKPHLPPKLITSGALSDAQLENVVYAGQAHQRDLADGTRMGYFIGDGTGVGKGRQLGGIIMDNWNQGRRRSIWISAKSELINDAKRDLGDLGFPVDKVIDGWKNSGRNLIGAGDGVAFLPYTSLRAGNPGLKPDGTLHPPEVKKGEAKPARIHLLHQWLGKDFDGVIVFDEAHQAGNAIDIKGTRGVKKASETGMSVLDLQKLFPRARVVYASATGATDVTNLSYADRLGIWGEGTPFRDKQQFFQQIRTGGLSAMEIVARDLKSMGRYLARTLSFEGVDNRPLVHHLTGDQREIYNELSRAWQFVLEHRDETMANTGAANDGRARSAANSAFYGAQQRFYNQLLTSMQMPSIFVDMKAELAKDHSCVLQVVNTDEAAQNRQIAAKASEAQEGDNYLEDLDLSPKEILQQYVANSYPTALYERYEDDNGNTKYRVVRDASGNVVNDPVALQRKQELSDKIGLLKAPSSPLGMLLDTFGVENVAEITGRSQRVVNKEQPDGTRKTVLEKNRGNAQRAVEAKEFQDGKRRILIFSDAGGTGFSYHASRKAKNQQRRVHYLVQAGWRADKAVQGLGRSHRSDQAVAPEFVPVSTDLKGHQRFISTISRRLGELGALTGGERKSAGGEMFDETSNLENDYAEDGVLKLFQDLHAGKVPGVVFADVCKRMGFVKQVLDEKTGEIRHVNKLIDESTGGLNTDAVPTIQRFLNRILALEVDQQNFIFDAFIERMHTRIENAKADGSYDPGTQTLKALSARKVSDDEVYKDPDSSATTRLVEIEHDHAQKIMKWTDLAKGGKLLGFLKNNRSGRLYAVKDGPTRTAENGSLVQTYHRIHPGGHDIVPQTDLTDRDKWTQVPMDQAGPVWQQQADALPKVRTDKDTYVVGTFLPIWDRLKIPNPKIWRVNLDTGETILGAHVPAKMVADVRSRLNAGMGAKRSPEEVFRSILERGESVDLANGWKLKRVRVTGEPRIEIANVSYGDTQTVKDLGGFMERIQYTPRFFLPTDDVAGVEAMRKLLEKSPAIIKTEGGEHAMAGATAAPKPTPKPRPLRTPQPPGTIPREELAAPANEWMRDIRRFQALVAPQTMGEPARFTADAIRMLGAQTANELARADAKLKPFRNSFDRTPVPAGWKYDETLPLPRNYAFVAAYEGGQAAAQGGAEAQAGIELQKLNERDVARVQALGTGALETVYEFYFPHLWSDPVRAKQVIGQFLAKNPLMGSKSFLKQRTHALFVHGLASGLRPLYDNPIDLWMLKKREIERYIFGHKLMKLMKAADMCPFVHVFARPPLACSKVNDPAFEKWAPPTVTIAEAYDAGIREATLDVLRSLGVPHERLAKIGGEGRWGVMSEEGGGSIRTKFGGPDWVIWHELGHVLDKRYPDLRPTMNATDGMQMELRALADQRIAGETVSANHKRYIRSMPEKMAVVLQAYLHAPDLMARIAPTVKTAFEGFLAAHPELSKINDIRPTLRLGSDTTEQRLPGPVKLGSYYLPEAAARVVNNYLSPGLNPHLWYRTLREASHFLNGVQLGFSAFHLGFTSMDASVSRFAIALKYLEAGHPVTALGKLLSVPVAPVTNFLQGRRLRAMVLSGDDTPANMARLVKMLEAGGGRIGQDAFWQTQFTRRLVRAIHAGTASGYISGTLLAPFALFEQSLRPIMDYVVPRQKLGVFCELAKFEMLNMKGDETPDQIRAIMRKSWDAVDNRMGQVVYDNHFYNKALKDITLLTFRAFGWQQGKYSIAGGAVRDTALAVKQLAQGKRPEFTHDMAYVMALFLSVGFLGALVTYLATGTKPQGKDYFMPRTGGTDANGNPQRMNFPSYVKDAIAYQKHPLTSFAHSLNPGISFMSDLLGNHDFYDVRIRNPDDPIWKQGTEVATFASKQFIPFSVAGMMKLREGSAPAWQQIAPFFGITPAPTRMTMTAAQELAAEITAAAMPTAPRTQEQYEKSQTIREAVQAIKAGTPSVAKEILLRGGLNPTNLNAAASQTIVDRLKFSPLQYQVHNMTAVAAMQVWRVADTNEQALLKPIIAAKIENSKTLGTSQQVIYLDELKK